MIILKDAQHQKSLKHYVPLPQDSGGPFRLMHPVEEYEWSRFWIKFVTEIIVS